MPSRVRVLPKLSKRGLFGLCIGLGLTHGLIGAWCIRASADWLFGWGGPLSTYGWFRIAAAVALLFLLPGVAVGMLMRRVHKLTWRLVGCGATYGAACLLGISFVILAANPGIMLAPWEPGLMGGFQFLMEVSFFLGIGGFVLSIAFVSALEAGAAIENFFGKKIVEQTGRVCWGCGYDLGSVRVGVCPECAEAFDVAAKPRAMSPRLLGALVRRRWWIAAVGVLVGVAPVLYQVDAYAAPSLRFMRACPPGASLQSATWLGNYVWNSGGRQPRAPISFGWWIADEGSDPAGLAVQFMPQDEFGRPAMFVSRACLMELTFPPGTVIAGPVPKQELLEPGTIRVHARLSSEQVASVIAARAIPAGLIDAIKAEAEKAGWKPVDAVVAPATADQNVDPAPFFH